MGDIVVDASVVAKWYIPEEDHDRARSLRDAYLDGRHELVAPALLPFEVMNALRYSGHYEGERLREASRTFPEYGIDLIPYRDVGPIAEIAEALDITLYDAAYLALAKRTETTVYTADSHLLDAAENSPYAERCSHLREYGS